MITLNKKRIKSVSESISAILFLSKLAAVCPMAKNKRYDKYEYKRSIFMVVIQIIVLLISVAHLGFIPYAVINIEEMSYISAKFNETLVHVNTVGNQKFITKMANIVLISILSILVRLSNLITMPKYLPGLLQDIESFDKILLKVDNFDFKRTIFLSVILVLVSWPYQIYSILLVTTDNWMAFLMFYLNLYNNFSVISCEFQFIALCWIIESRFDKLNNNIGRMSCGSYLENEEASLITLSNSKKCSKIITNCFQKLNKLFGYQLMVILCGLGLNVLFGLYFTIFGGFTKNSNKTSVKFQEISNITNELLWSLYYLARFFLLCYAAEVLTKKLWIFLAQTVTNKMYFSACGFFKINKELISTAVSVGTTYLVILAQFQKKNE